MCRSTSIHWLAKLSNIAFDKWWGSEGRINIYPPMKELARDMFWNGYVARHRDGFEPGSEGDPGPVMMSQVH
jgi:hypothetical protein